jgi:hypothetical protein
MEVAHQTDYQFSKYSNYCSGNVGSPISHYSHRRVGWIPLLNSTKHVFVGVFVLMACHANHNRMENSVCVCPTRYEHLVAPDDDFVCCVNLLDVRKTMCK